MRKKTCVLTYSGGRCTNQDLSPKTKIDELDLRMNFGPILKKLWSISDAPALVSCRAAIRWYLTLKNVWWFQTSIYSPIFRCVHASLYEGLSVRPSVGRSVGPSVMRFFWTTEFEWKRHINHRISIEFELWNITCPLTIEKKHLKNNLKQFKTI